MSEPFTCPGCHDGTNPHFEHFCDALNITDDELPVALIAWAAQRAEGADRG